MSVIHGANYGTPTLDLNFAKNKSLIDTVSGRNYVTFSRAQANYLTTYVGSDGLIKYASADEPRFDHNPLTGECLGLLVEEQRQNLLTYSEQFDDGTWLKENGASVLSNSTVAPNGTFSADTIVESTSTTRPRLRTNGVNVVNGSSYVFSFYVKSAGRNFLQVILLNNTTTSVIDISTGQYVSGSTNVNVSPAGNGWFRVSIWGTFNQASGNYRSDIFLQSTSSTSDYTGDGTSGIYIWGAQLEAGSFPTSYIPTSGSTVTRSADSSSITGTNFSRWYNQTEGTMFVNARMQFQPSVAGQFPDIYTTGSFPNRLWSLYLLNGVNNLVIGTDTHTQSLQTFSSSPQTFKVAQALSNTSLSWSGSKDGGSVLSGSLSKSITNISSISLGGTAGAVKHISRLTYYPTRLQNYQLQQLTK